MPRHPRIPLTLREPQLNAARAAVSRDEARLAEANLALSRTQVTAPFDGFVREESVDVGQIVAAGQTVGRLFASDAVEVVVPLSDADAALIPGLWDLKAGDGVRRVGARVVAQYGDGSYAWEGYVDRGEVSLDTANANHRRDRACAGTVYGWCAAGRVRWCR